MRGEAGMSRVELESEYPGWLVDELIGHEGWNAARDYESDAEVEARTRRVAQWLTADWVQAAEATAEAQIAAFVIHANFKRLLIGELLETDRWPSSDTAIWNTAITQLHYEGGEWKLVQWNAIEHLELSLRT
jgi:broad specificity phosphatase PhoE